MNTVNRVIVLVFVLLLGALHSAHGKTTDITRQSTTFAEQEIARYVVSNPLSREAQRFQARVKEGDSITTFAGTTVVGTISRQKGGKEIVTNNFGERALIKEVYDRSPYTMAPTEVAHGKILAIAKDSGKTIASAEITVTVSIVGKVKTLTTTISYGDAKNTKEVVAETYSRGLELPTSIVSTKTVGGEVVYTLRFVRLDDDDNEMPE